MKFFISNTLALIFACTLFLNVTYAEESQKLNAGLLSDIWFSKLKLEDKDTITIFATFQNTSNQTLEGEFSILINETEVQKKKFKSNHDELTKLSTDWNASVGEFDITVRIDSLTQNGKSISPSTLIAYKTTRTIKINQKIDIEFVKEKTGELYANTVSTLNMVADNTSKSLDRLRKNIDTSDGEVAGFQYEREEDAQVAQDSQPSSTTTSPQPTTQSSFIYQFKKDPVAVATNSSISIAQFMLKYWPVFFAIFAILVIWFLLRRRD